MEQASIDHGAESRAGRRTVHPVLWSGIEATGKNRHRGDCGNSPVAAAAMMGLSRVSKHYVTCGHTDLRRRTAGLAAIVIQQFGCELREDSLFLFCGRRTD